MVTQASADLPPPLGRDAEIAALERFLAAPVDGRGPAALLLLGEAGIGKTTLLRRAGTLAEAHGCRVLRAAPARAEQGLAYAVLADLLRGVEPAVLDDLPAPQQRALRVATLEEDAGAGQVEPRTIAAAFLSVRAEPGRANPGPRAAGIPLARVGEPSPPGSRGMPAARGRRFAARAQPAAAGATSGQIRTTGSGFS